MGIWALVVDGIFIVATIAYLTVNVVQSGSPLGRPSPTSSATATAPVTDTAPPSDVQPGQCVIDHQLEKVRAPGEEVSIDTVEVVPCDQPHTAEAYLKVRIDGKDYPSDARIARAARECRREFKTFVGVPLSRSKLTIYYYFPYEDAWAQGQRQVTCLAANTDGTRLTGTVMDSKR